jgi:ankyrin repeat protein
MKLMLPLLVFSLASVEADVSAGDMFATAAMHGDLNSIERLLTAGFSPNAPMRAGQTPLAEAMLIGQPEVVRLLLAWHADPNMPMDSRPAMNSDTPLQYAAQTGNLRMATTLLSGGADIEAKGTARRTALHFAVAESRLDMIRFLIQKGSDVNSRDGDGASPLDHAVGRGSLDAVALLLAHGARLNETDARMGATPVNQAAASGDTRLIQYLLQFHPDLRIPDKRDNSPLDNAIRSGNEDSALSVLDAAPSPDLGKAMEAATRKDEARVVEALLRHGAPVNDTLPSGYTPLDAAAFAGAAKVAGVLLDAKADPDLTGRDGTTPLEDASVKGFESIARMLLDRGAKPGTALYAAASAGETSIVKLLLERGANPSVCGPTRKTPYQAAVDGGYKDVAALIGTRGGETGCVKR